MKETSKTVMVHPVCFTSLSAQQPDTELSVSPGVLSGPFNTK